MARDFNILEMTAPTVRQAKPKDIDAALEKNFDPGKPDVGHRPNLDDQIRVLYDRKKRLEHQMRVHVGVFRKGHMTPELLSDYQDMNEKLRKATIEMAECVYIRNML